MKFTNGEFVETIHSTLRKHEEKHGLKIVKKIGSPAHRVKSLNSISSINALNSGFSPARSFMIRTKSSPLTL